MSPTRLRLLFLCLAAFLAAWLLVVWLVPEPLDERDANFSRIEDRLYQGGDVTRPPPGTTAVLNLCESADPYECEFHAWHPIRDATPVPTLDWLRQRVEEIDTHRRAGRTVFVHCRQGVSRSGMVVTAFLMAEHAWSRDEALAFVRTRRPLTRPNPAFMELLIEWELELKDRHEPRSK